MSNIARPFIPWVGGKEKLVPYVRQVFPDNVSQYLEPFGGGGAVLLSLPPNPKRLDIYNDLDSELVKCDRCEEREACELVDANTFSPAIKISPELLRDAGIEPGSKLICLPEDEEGVLHITAADYRFDLTDVPPDILQQLRERNVCLDDLEDHLMSEDVVKEVCDGR